MKPEIFPIEEVAEELASTVVAEAEAQSASVAPQCFAMADIRRIITSAIDSEISSMGFARHLEILATMPDAADAAPEMRTVRFPFGEYAAEVLRESLESRLLPVRYKLTFAHYEERIVDILKGAGDLAAELIEGPAKRCMKADAVEAYREDLDRVFAEAAIPPYESMNALLCRGVEFFSPLDKCLARPEWGLPVGISEETVGRTAAEIKEWFNMLGDLQHLNMRRTSDFSQVLTEEIAAMAAPSIP